MDVTNRVRFIYHREPHHSNHSGYDQIANCFGSCIPMIDISRRRTRVVPAHIAMYLWKRSGVRFYGHPQFYMELSAAIDMFKGRNCIYHFLHGDTNYRYLGLLRGFRGHKLVATVHGYPERFNQWISNPTIYRALDAIILVGTNQFTLFESIVDRDILFWVPHGVDTNFFSPPKAQREHDKVKCLFVGVHMRDFQTLRATIEIINQINPSVEFDIVTFRSNFSHFHGLKQVRMFENVPESSLLRLYQESDLLLLPLLDCTANNSLLEALACGLPIVSTDVGAIRDYLTESCSYLAPPHNAQAMAEAVLELAKNKTLRHKMGINARRQAATFDWAVVAEKIKEVYIKIT